MKYIKRKKRKLLKIKRSSKMLTIIDKYYDIHSSEKSSHFCKVLEDSTKQSSSLILTVEEWVLLHTTIHDKIIKEEELQQDNSDLKLKYSALIKEVNSLKNNAIESYIELPSGSVFYN